MINKFMTVYAGHIDIPDHGQNATPANDRRYNNDELASVFDKTEAIAKVMDELGYDTLWLAEHHFQHEGYECLPNILMCAVHLAHVTKQLRIGCGFNIAPMWHPLRLAEDYATADILTKGRTVFGVRHGIKGLVGGGAAIMAEGPIQAYQRVANDMGHDLKLGENLTIGVAFYLAKTKEQAVRELKPLYEEHVKMFAPLGFVPGLTPE